VDRINTDDIITQQKVKTFEQKSDIRCAHIGRKDNRIKLTKFITEYKSSGRRGLGRRGKRWRDKLKT
jgi:hypothetical protein